MSFVRKDFHPQHFSCIISSSFPTLPLAVVTYLPYSIQLVPAAFWILGDTSVHSSQPFIVKQSDAFYGKCFLLKELFAKVAFSRRCVPFHEWSHGYFQVFVFPKQSREKLSSISNSDQAKLLLPLLFIILITKKKKKKKKEKAKLVHLKACIRLFAPPMLYSPKPVKSVSLFWEVIVKFWR